MAQARGSPGTAALTTDRATALRASAPAKLNLALAVTGRRPDGYHTLRSVFIRLALHDVLEVARSEDPEGKDSLVLAGDADTPIEGNLVLRAVAELRWTMGRPLPALRLRLTKRIPAGAGLAGGSSDAAAAMDLAMRAWGVRLHPAERLAVALRLGADVPFFAVGHPAALISGIGEGLLALPPPRPAAGIVLVTPGERLATPTVFAELDRQRRVAEEATLRIGHTSQLVDRLAAALRDGLDGAGLTALAPMLRDANDLWTPAGHLSPTLIQARQRLERALGRPVLMTGSGSTLFAIYPSVQAAVDAAGGLEAARPHEIADARIEATTSSLEGGDRA